MKFKQISISIENSPGRLYEITHPLGDAGINLRALNLVDSGDFGMLRLLVSDLTKTRRILMEKHMPARVDDVVAVEIEDKPGRLSASETADGSPDQCHVHVCIYRHVVKQCGHDFPLQRQ